MEKFAFNIVANKTVQYEDFISIGKLAMDAITCGFGIEVKNSLEFNAFISNQNEIIITAANVHALHHFMQRNYDPNITLEEVKASKVMPL